MTSAALLQQLEGGRCHLAAKKVIHYTQMKPFRTDLFLFFGILLLTAISLLPFETDVIDIQLHDTYFVFDKITMLVLIAGPLMFLSFLARGLYLRFRNPATNAGLLIGLILLAMIAYRIIPILLTFPKIG